MANTEGSRYPSVFAFREMEERPAPSCRWYTILVALACVTFCCVSTAALVVLASQHTTAFTVAEHSPGHLALVDKVNHHSVSTARYEHALQSPLSAKGALSVKWITLPGAREEVVAFCRVPMARAPSECVASEDDFCYLFATRTAVFSASNSRLTGNLVFTKVDVELEHVTAQHRALLQTAVNGTELTEAAQAIAQGSFNGTIFNELRVQAAVDHLYGVKDPTCQPGTNFVYENGTVFEELCGGFAGGYTPQVAHLCQPLIPGFYDVQRNGRCLDYCFYLSVNNTCGDGYWTCAMGVGDRLFTSISQNTTEPEPDPPGLHLSKDFCFTTGDCAFPLCEKEGDFSKWWVAPPPSPPNPPRPPPLSPGGNESDYLISPPPQAPPPPSPPYPPSPPSPPPSPPPGLVQCVRACAGETCSPDEDGKLCPPGAPGAPLTSAGFQCRNGFWRPESPTSPQRCLPSPDPAPAIPLCSDHCGAAGDRCTEEWAVCPSSHSSGHGGDLGYGFTCVRYWDHFVWTANTKTEVCVPRASPPPPGRPGMPPPAPPSPPPGPPPVPFTQGEWRSEDSVWINFQPDATPVPHGYEKDIGALFGERGNGLVYGWSCDVSGSAADRQGAQTARSSLLQLDPTCHCDQAPTWSIEVPTGKYLVIIGYGDYQNQLETTGCKLQGEAASVGTLPAGYPNEYARTVEVGDDHLITFSGRQCEACGAVSYIRIAEAPPSPLWFDSATRPIWGGSSWQAGHEFCQRQGMELCPYNAYCPQGGSHPPFGGVKLGDFWAPYAGDGPNAWLQIGHSTNAADDLSTTCMTHEEVEGARPEWGTSTERAMEKEYMMCCPLSTSPRGAASTSNCTSSTAAASAANHIRLISTGALGNTYGEQYANTTLEECAAVCYEDADCKGVVHGTEAGAQTLAGTSDGSTAGQCMKILDVGERQLSSSNWNMYDVFGADTPSLFESGQPASDTNPAIRLLDSGAAGSTVGDAVSANTLEDCASACYAHAGCEGVAYGTTAGSRTAVGVSDGVRSKQCVMLDTISLRGQDDPEFNLFTVYNASASDGASATTGGSGAPGTDADADVVADVPTADNSVPTTAAPVGSDSDTNTTTGELEAPTAAPVGSDSDTNTTTGELEAPTAAPVGSDSDTNTNTGELEAPTAAPNGASETFSTSDSDTEGVATPVGAGSDGHPAAPGESESPPTATGGLGALSAIADGIGALPSTTGGPEVVTGSGALPIANGALGAVPMTTGGLGYLPSTAAGMPGTTTTTTTITTTTTVQPMVLPTGNSSNAQSVS